MANLTATALNTLNSAGIEFERSYEEHMRSRQAALERQYRERQYREQQYMLSRAYADPPIGQFLAPMPPPPPVSGSHKRNKRLLLCHP
jgi:hypothetical protein